MVAENLFSVVLISAVIDIRRDTTRCLALGFVCVFVFGLPLKSRLPCSHSCDSKRIRRQQYLDMRRTHTKSRQGCSNCKRRHIKVTFPILFLSNSAMSLSLNAYPVQSAMWIAISRQHLLVHYQLHLVLHPEAKAPALSLRLDLHRRRGI